MYERCLLLGRKAMTNLDSILKSRDITLPTKVHLVKALVFPVVMYEHESWTIKKAECRRFDAFELWCWRRLLRVYWTTRRSNQSMLKEISPEYSLYWWWNWNSNTLAIWCEELTQWKRPWFWERLKVGEGDNRGWDGWMSSPTCWTWVWASSGRWWWTRKPGVLESDTIEQLNWTEWVTSKEMLSFSAAKSEKTLWREVLGVVSESEDFAGPGATLGKAMLDKWGGIVREPGAALGVLSDGLWNKRHVWSWRLLAAWGLCAAFSRRAACMVCFSPCGRSVELHTQGSCGQWAAGRALWFLPSSRALAWSDQGQTRWKLAQSFTSAPNLQADFSPF